MSAASTVPQSELGHDLEVGDCCTENCPSPVVHLLLEDIKLQLAVILIDHFLTIMYDEHWAPSEPQGTWTVSRTYI